MNESMPMLRMAADPDAHRVVMARIPAAATDAGVAQIAYLHPQCDDTLPAPNALEKQARSSMWSAAWASWEGIRFVVGFVDSV